MAEVLSIIKLESQAIKAEFLTYKCGQSHGHYVQIGPCDKCLIC